MTRPRRAGWPPEWTQTIRFRLTVTYSAVLFGLAAVAVAGVYLVLTAYLDAGPLDPVEVPVGDGGTIRAADVESVEAAANHKTLGLLRTLSLQVVGGLFVVSLAIGWWLSGRALRPVRRITATARDISATDLSRRIALDGPRDELRELADTVDGMLARLDAAFSAQRTMVGDASHELRNPLAVIQANVDAVLAHDDVDPDARAQASAVVTRAAGRMTQLVEDLLASARRSSPAFVDVDVALAATADEVADEIALLAKERDLRLARAPGPGVVGGDPRALARAVQNLLSNAVRLAPAGSVITVATGSRDGWAWAAVRDEGPGIAAADQESVFDRFVSGPGGRGRRGGLGLAIVRQIVESHDGHVALHSAPGVGSTFVLWFPDQAAEATRTPSPPEADPVGPPDQGCRMTLPTL